MQVLPRFVLSLCIYIECNSKRNRMKIKNDDQVSETESSNRRARRMYSRELLLSFSELDICKKLPHGFNSSILNEFECASNSAPERSRIPESLSSQNLRRGEYASSPPTRGDSGLPSRAPHGRWDTHSSGSNDKDSDTLSNSESESGWQYVTHSRRSWQKSEHDGLLGSGSFPKASGYTSAPTAKGRGSGQYQLNRSNEPYQPPRPYKAAPHSRRDDVINEETFGSSESSNLDREEEEKKRRASFEQFRKEQKALQEKQKQFPEKHKENVDPDIAALLANSEDDRKRWDKNTGVEDMAQNISHGDPAKGSFAAQTSSARPLVPPGFAGSLEKNLGAKSSNSHTTLKVGHGVTDENIARIGGFVVANGTSGSLLDEQSFSVVDTSEKYENKTAQQHSSVTSEKSVIPPLDGAIHENSVGLHSTSYIYANQSNAYGGVRNDKSSDLYVEKIPKPEVKGTSSQEHSTSILAKLFGSASIVDTGPSGLSEPTGVTADIGIPSTFQSSKFTHWFLEEDNRPGDDLSSSKPEDLLSLIVNGDKDGSQVSKVSDKRPSLFSIGSTDPIHSVTTTSSPVATVDPPYQSSNSGGSQVVLTCEDLEQSILSEFSDSSTNVDQSFQAWNTVDAKSEKRPEVDNQASQHLLSLLQKGTSAKDITQYSIPESSENLNVYETPSAIDSHSTLGDAEKGTMSENSLTLETLFGTAFMKELQSAQAPVSVQRGSVGGIVQTDALDSQRFPFPVSDEGFSPRTSSRSNIEGDRLNINQIQQRESNKNGEAWLEYNASQGNAGSNLSNSNVAERINDALDIQLPDEESLFTLSEPVIPQHPQASETDISSSSSMPVDIVGKLAALNAVLQKGRSAIPGFDDPPFLRAPRNPMESDLQYRNQFEQPTSPYAHLQMNHGRPEQLNHGRHLYQPSDSHPSHMSPPLKAMGLENSLHSEYSQYQIPANHNYPSCFQHVPNGPTRLAPPAHHPMLQQMQMQGNALPPHLQRGLPRGGPMAQFGINHMSGYAPEARSMQNFSYGHHQPNYSGHEPPMQGHAGGRGGHSHPEGLEKLIEMELRANLKQMHPAPGGAHSLGNHGHGIDMGFRYR